jgi:hypothetical protein
MSAITPFLERQNDPAQTVALEENFDVPADISEAVANIETTTSVEELQSQGNLSAPFEPTGFIGPVPEEAFYVGDITAEAISQQHAALVTMAWIRRSVYQALVGRSYRVQARDKDGANPRDVYIILDGPAALPDGFDEDDPRFPVAPWSPASSPNAQQFSLLSWTTKMGAPSFSLPAGAIIMGGSCPGANAAQSIVPVETLRGAARNVARVLGRPVRLQQAICSHCYAEGGQYATGGVQFTQVMRYIWTRDALTVDIDELQESQRQRQRRASTLWSPFVPGTTRFHGQEPPPGVRNWIAAMTYAIANARYLLDGGKHPDSPVDYDPEAHEGRFFRIHDSGDFFAPGYLWMWKQVAEAFPDIVFWAPTRYWATGKGVEHVNAINAPRDDSPNNLTIRPSAYHINEPPPRNLGPGWSAGATAFSENEKDAGAGHGWQWDCGAYAVDDPHVTCRAAIDPILETRGCRACWLLRDQEVNYTLHGAGTQDI